MKLKQGTRQEVKNYHLILKHTDTKAGQLSGY